MLRIEYKNDGSIDILEEELLKYLPRDLVNIVKSYEERRVVKYVDKKDEENKKWNTLLDNIIDCTIIYTPQYNIIYTPQYNIIRINDGFISFLHYN